jgi:nucleotide-binding universal stress UspA family protein
MPVIANRPTLSFENVMYAADFSPIADCAGRYAKGLAQRFGSKVHIAHVVPSYEDLNSDAVKADQRVRRQRLVERQLEFSAAGIDTQTFNSSEYPVPSALLLIERQIGPDLIVMGTQSKSSLDRLLIGSTAEHLIRNARSPVLTVGPNVIPPAEGPLTFERIVFASDFSDPSNIARSLALGFAQESGAHLWICHIVNNRADSQTYANAKESDFRKELERLVPEEAYDWCSPEYTVEYGSPSKGILGLAERVHADLIVMGARTRSFWLTHIQRGVTQEVLAQATCPVLTVH